MNWDEAVSMCEAEWGPRVLERVALSIQCNSDSDLHIHAPSAELVLMWCAKIIFVRRTIEMRHSDFHGWIDAGYKFFRDKDIPERRFPCDDFKDIPSQKIIVTTASNTCHPEYFKPPQKDCVIGGIWFGETDVCRAFIQACCDEYGKRLKSPRIFSVVTEQDIWTLVGQRLGIFHLVPRKRDYDLPWLSSAKRSYLPNTIVLTSVCVFLTLIIVLLFFLVLRGVPNKCHNVITTPSTRLWE